MIMKWWKRKKVAENESILTRIVILASMSKYIFQHCSPFALTSYQVIVRTCSKRELTAKSCSTSTGKLLFRSSTGSCRFNKPIDPAGPGNFRSLFMHKWRWHCSDNGHWSDDTCCLVLDKGKEVGYGDSMWVWGVISWVS